MKVAAACGFGWSASHSEGPIRRGYVWRGHTDRTIHGLAPRLLDCASVAILSYSFPMPAGALAGPGREKGVLTSSLRAGESFDMVVVASELRALVVCLFVYRGSVVG